MSAAWRFLPLSEPSDPLWNMACDEVLLLSQDSAPVLRFYRWSRPALSIGYFQDPAAVARTAGCEQSGVTVVRRVTGGGIVPHGEDLTLSIVLPFKNPHFPENVKESYKAIHALLMKSLLPLYPGLHEMRAGKSLRPRGLSACFEEPTCFDVGLAGKKVLGSSQRRKNGRMLHQTAILLDGDLNGAADAIRAGFERSLDIRLVESRLSGEEASETDRLVREKYSQNEFSFALESSVDTRPR